LAMLQKKAFSFFSENKIWSFAHNDISPFNLTTVQMLQQAICLANRDSS
jgi:hypothetical protein